MRMTETGDNFQVDDLDYFGCNSGRPEHTSATDDEALFEQYIRSPSPVPAVAGNEQASDTVAARLVTTMPAAPEVANSSMRKNTTPSGPRIRLHVNPRKGVAQSPTLASGAKRSRKKSKASTAAKAMRRSVRKERVK